MSGPAAGAAIRAGWTITRDGFAFDRRAKTWWIRTPLERYAFNFDLPGTTPGFQAELRDTIGRRLGSQSPRQCHADLSILRVAIGRAAAADRSRAIDAVTLADFHAFELGLPERGQYRATALLASLRRLHLHRFARIAADLEEALPILDPYVPPPTSAVRTMCPVQGALTKGEKAELVRQLHARHAAGEMGSEDYALSLAVALLVPRPSQVALLKVKDMVATRNGAALRIPCVKRRDGSPVRSAWDEHPLSPSLARVMFVQRDKAVQEAVAKGLEAAEGALFPDRRAIVRTGDRLPELAGFVGHATGHAMVKRIAGCLSGTAIVSERLGHVQRITSVRARRTVATGLRADGHSYAVIGRLLGHPDGWSAPKYCEDTVEMADRVSAALAPHLVPLAALFVDFPGNDAGPGGAA